jgi:hypothetical protein
MSEDRPTLVNEPVPPSSDVVNYFREVGDYLRRLTSSIFGGAAAVTAGAAQYARDVKAAIDPVIGEVGNTAQLARDVSLIGVLSAPKNKTVREFYDRTNTTAEKVQRYKTSVGPAWDKAINENVLTPEQLRARVQSAPLPPKPVEAKPKKKKKKKRNTPSGYGKPVYKGKIRVSRRRK